MSPPPLPALMKLRSLAEYWQRDRYCLIGLTNPLRPSTDEAVATPSQTMGFSRKRRFAQSLNFELCPLVGLRLLQSLTRPCRCPLPSGLATAARAAPLMGSLAPSAPEVPAEQPSRSLPHSVRCALRVSHPLSALLPARPSGLVSCRKRPWGFPFRAFSSRGAVPPFGGRCPPDVHHSPSVPHFTLSGHAKRAEARCTLAKILGTLLWPSSSRALHQPLRGTCRTRPPPPAEAAGACHVDPGTHRRRPAPWRPRRPKPAEPPWTLLAAGRPGMLPRPARGLRPVPDTVACPDSPRDWHGRCPPHAVLPEQHRTR
jgi:hypothetical protein